MKRSVMILLITLLLTGCAAAPVPSAPSILQEPTTAPTVGNIFTTPPTTEPPSTNPTASDPTEPTSPVYDNLGSFSFGFMDNDQNFDEELGRFILYQGGEMHLRFRYTFTGTIGNDGVGPVLLLDGIPQPYKTAESDEYAYVHTFYPPTKLGGLIVAELIFTPVTGKAGDKLNLSVFSLMQPDHSIIEEPTKPFRLTNSELASDAVFVMEATPGQCPLPEVTERVNALTVSTTDLTSTDTRGWSAEELQNDASFEIGFPKKQSFSYSIYNMGPDKQLHFHAEIFSPGFVQWALVVYIDNLPVTLLTENDIRFTVPAGQKVVVDMQLSMEGTDGEMPVYAALIPRNRHAPEVRRTNCDITLSNSYYLLAARDSTELSK